MNEFTELERAVRSIANAVSASQLIAGLLISLVIAPTLVASSLSEEGGAPQEAIRCANPPNSAEFEALLPCISGRKVRVTLRSGNSFAGKVEVARGGFCAAGKACEVTLSSRFRKRKVSVADVVSVRYRAPSSVRQRTLGWATGIGAAVGIAALLFRGEDQAFATSGDDAGTGYLATPLFVAVGTGTGVLVGRGRTVTVQLVGEASSRPAVSPDEMRDGQ